METTSYLFYHAVQMAYLHVALERLFPDRFPIWFLPVLYIVANGLRWFTHDFENWANYSLLVSTGFVYGLLVGLYWNDLQISIALSWAFVGLIALAVSYLIAELLQYSLYDFSWRLPIAFNIFFNTTLMASLYIVWPILTRPFLQEPVFWIVFLGSPIVLGVTSYYSYVTVGRIVSLTIDFPTWTQFMAVTTLISSVAVAFCIGVIWWWIDGVEIPTIYRLSQSLLVGLAIQSGFFVWMQYGPHK